MSKVIFYKVAEEYKYGLLNSMTDLQDATGYELQGYFPDFGKYEYKLASGFRVYQVSYNFFNTVMHGGCELGNNKQVDMLVYLYNTINDFVKLDKQNQGAAWSIPEVLICKRAICLEYFKLSHEAWFSLMMGLSKEA